MNKAKMIIVTSCGDCPFCEVDDYEFGGNDGMSLIKLTLKCKKLNRRIRREEGFLRDCPLKKYDRKG